jgi:hypothetical protein
VAQLGPAGLQRGYSTKESGLMTSVQRIAFVKIVVALAVAQPCTAVAQSLGVFRWQMQPYCNVVTFTVVQQGPAYLLIGSDDLCGAGVGNATGAASANPNGTIAMGFSVVTPSGATAHVTATVRLADVSGTWQDADEHGGVFLFNPPPAGSAAPRPVPSRSAVITSAQLAASVFAGTGSATTVSRSDHDHDSRYFTQSQITALVADAGAAVVIGPGSNNPASLTPQLRFLLETVTTPKAGRLLIAKSVSISSFACTINSSYWLYLLVDGVPLPGSVVAADNVFRGQVTGVTADALPAGDHSVEVGVRCIAGTHSSSAVYLTSRASIVVLP